MIDPIAALLGIPSPLQIYANNLIFSEDGSYLRFDEDELTSKEGGKGKVIKEIVARHGKPVIMIGDGATDLEAREFADLFIGYGGVVERKVVKEKADWYITNFDELSALL